MASKARKASLRQSKGPRFAFPGQAVSIPKGNLRPKNRPLWAFPQRSSQEIVTGYIPSRGRYAGRYDPGLRRLCATVEGLQVSLHPNGAGTRTEDAGGEYGGSDSKSQAGFLARMRRWGLVPTITVKITKLSGGVGLAWLVRSGRLIGYWFSFVWS
jgi:hypothetical protein